MTSRFFADVAELADAQVSEACDGDIVEVQVLSSAPIRIHSGGSGVSRPAVFVSSYRSYMSYRTHTFLSKRPEKNFVTDFRRSVSNNQRSILKGDY